MRESAISLLNGANTTKNESRTKQAGCAIVPESEGHKQSQGASPIKRRLRILHLEADSKQTALVASTLKAQGVDADIVVTRTRSAFRAVVNQGTFDVVISDFNLPAFDGLSALAIVRQRYPEVPFIFFAEALGEETAVRALKNGASDYILKSRLEYLGRSIMETIHKAQYCHSVRRTDAHIVHANRLYAVLSQVNQSIIRVASWEQLFKDICTIAVNHGGFIMAWIGIVDEADMVVKPIFHAGFEDGYLQTIKISLSDAPESRDPTGEAIRRGVHFINMDTQRNPLMLPWRQEALRRGYCSSGAFPIKLEGTVIGAFTVYSSESDFFDNKEVALLDEIAGDISYALDYIERQHRRNKQKTFS